MSEGHDFIGGYIGQMVDLVAEMRDTFAEQFYQADLEIAPKLREIMRSHDAIKVRAEYEEHELPIIDLYSHIITIENNMSQILRTLDAIDIYGSKSGMSMTHILSIAEKLGNLDKMRQAYPAQNFYIEIEKAALAFLMGLKIADAYHIYEENGNIFAIYLQYLNATIPEATAEGRMAIEAQLEKLKDDAISQDMLAVVPREERARELLQTYGLFPTLQQASLSEIASKVLKREVVVDLAAFIELMARNKIGMALIELADHANLEFSTTHLTEKGKKLPQGLSNAVLEYYSIFKIFKNDTPSAIPAEMANLADAVEHKFLDGKMYVVADSDVKAYVIIRTIGGGKYNLMAKRAVVGGVVPALVVPKSAVNKILRGASPRIECYNRISNFQIASYIGKPKADEVEGETNQIQTDMIALKKLLIMRLDSYVYAAIYKIKPRNVYEAAMVLDGTKIHATVMDTLMAFSDETDPELLISWMACINGRAFKFLKIMLNEFAKSKLNDKLFKEKTAESMAVFLVALFKQIVDTAASKTIPLGDDIYRTILRKKIIIHMAM